MNLIPFYDNMNLIPFLYSQQILKIIFYFFMKLMYIYQTYVAILYIQAYITMYLNIYYRYFYSIILLLHLLKFSAIIVPTIFTEKITLTFMEAIYRALDIY